MELEERSIERLPERCESCGTELTEGEKAAALEDGSSIALCTTCAAEAEPTAGEEEEFGG